MSILLLLIGFCLPLLQSQAPAQAQNGDGAPAGVAVALFDGTTLAGWRALGDARYVVDDGCILGEVAGGGQSFLISEREFGDFVLQVELRNELPGNSGIQVRSQLGEKARVFGYQIEIDPSERAWSGGLYDEGRRGWLDDLADDQAARAAFRPGEWNRYRIECRGAWLRAWVNDVPTADYLDAQDLAGFIGLQVHSGNNTRMRWRKLALTDFGARSWRAVTITPPWTWVPLQGDGGAARFLVQTDPERPHTLELKVDFDGQVRTLVCAEDSVPEQRPIPVDVFWQADRRSVQVAGRVILSEVQLTPRGERAQVALSLDPPRR